MRVAGPACRFAHAGYVSMSGPFGQIALRPSAMRAHEREHGALRVAALNDPAAAWNLMRAVEHLAAFGFDAGFRRADRVDREIMQPGWCGHAVGLSHHAAD